MVGRTFLLGSLLLGTIGASPVAVSSNVKVARSSADSKIDTVAGWAHEWLGTEAPVIATRDLEASNVIDKVAGWAKDYYSTDAVAKREVDSNDVVDTVASWTKEWLHTGEDSTPKARDTESGETVDETIDRFADKVKNYFNQPASATKRDLGGLSGIIHTILGFMENLDWNAITKFTMQLLSSINLNPIMKGLLSFIDTTFFGGGSSGQSHVATRALDIDWSSMIQKGLQWMEKLF